MKFKKYTVEELVKLDMLEKPMDGNHGEKHPKSKDYINKGIPFIMVSDLNNGKINYNNCKFISKSTRDRLDKGFAKPNDVLLSHKATIGLTALVEDDFKEIVLTPQLTYYRVKNNINNKYLKYYFDSPYFQNILKSWATSGSTRAYLGITAQLKLPILLPDIKIQNKIANILSKIDKKIELNNQINDNLFELTKQLYKRWFIEFEFPNKDGNPYKSSNGKMVESELGLIPENWSIKRLDEISINFDSKRKPLSGKDREEKKGNIPYYGATSIIDYVNEYIFDDIFVLMGEDGSVINSDNTPVLQYIWKKCWVNNHAHVLQGKGISTEHLMECLRATDVSSIITGAVQLKINQANMNTLKYFYATEETNKDFDEKISKIYEKIRVNTEQNEILEQLRDTLLPKLMNGEIDLDRIET